MQIEIHPLIWVVMYENPDRKDVDSLWSSCDKASAEQKRLTKLNDEEGGETEYYIICRSFEVDKPNPE